MIELPYSLVIEATEEPDYFGFYSPDLEGFSGIGHSCAIHTADEKQVMKLAMKTKVGRVNVNMPNCLVNSGSWYNGQPFTTTIGCGTWAGNITSDNINWKQMLNYTWVSRPVSEYIPTDEDLFGDYLKKWGRD